MNARPLPTNIPDYLEHLRRSLAGADPALIQDALYDAEEYLRSEMAENPDKSEAEVIAQVASSYGAPDEVADIYRDTEVKVQTALRAPPPRQHRSLLGKFFGVIAEPRTYAALFYMLLSMATGIFYFTWAVTGFLLSASLSILIFGIVFAVLFFGTVRVLALVEGRLVEVMLGERMPRRPPYADRDQPLRVRIMAMFTDPRTWSTLLYMVLMLPLGVVYFTLAVTGIALSLAFVAAPIMVVLVQFGVVGGDLIIDGGSVVPPMVVLPFVVLLGIVLPFAVLHLARGIARLQGALAKHLLVKSAA